MNETELKLCTQLDQFFQSCLFFLGHYGNAHGNISAACGRDIRFINIFRRQTFSQSFNGDITVFIEFLLDFFLVVRVRYKLKDKFGASVEVNTAADRSCGILADQGNHVTGPRHLL